MRTAFSLLVTAAIVVISLTILLNAMKRSTLFFPMRFPEGDWSVEELAIAPRDLFIPTPDGLRLHAWHFAAADPEAPLLIWSHGNGGNLTHRAPIAAALASRGVSAIVYDYRGYGKSEGRPTENGLYVDALAVYDFVIAQRLATPSRVVAYGESLGGPYAAHIAAHREVCCLVFESSFHSAASVASETYHVPIGVFLGNSLSTARLAKRASVPALVMHGTEDRVIPFKSGMALYDALPDPKERFVVEGADHNELPFAREYYPRVVGFIREHAR